MDKVYIALAAFAGALLSALLGWLDASGSFNGRKFAATAVRGLLAAIVFAIGYSFAEHIGIIDVFAAVLGGAGIDVVVKRAGGGAKRIAGKGK